MSKPATMKALVFHGPFAVRLEERPGSLTTAILADAF